MRTVRRCISLSIFTGTLILILSVLLSCETGVDCNNATDLSPRDMLLQSEYVLTGVLVRVDTLADLGEMTELDSRIHHYLFQFTYRALEVFKAPTVDTLVHLWMEGTLALENGWSSTRSLEDTVPQLLYGNRITSADSIINVMRMLVLVDTLKYITGKPDPANTAWELTQQADRAIAASINGNQLLPTVYQESSVCGPVLYASDFLYCTNRSFYSGLVTYCDWEKLRAYRIESKEYLAELRSATNE